jgi:hypothetical protein
MVSPSKKAYTFFALAFATLLACSANAAMWSDRDGIQVSPSTFTLIPEAELLVTVHTEIAYGNVKLWSLEIDIEQGPLVITVPNDELMLKTDARGNLVVKFVIGADEQAALGEGSTSVSLYAVMADNSTFFESDQIDVTFRDPGYRRDQSSH